MTVALSKMIIMLLWSNDKKNWELKELRSYFKTVHWHSLNIPYNQNSQNSAVYFLATLEIPSDVFFNIVKDDHRVLKIKR